MFSNEFVVSCHWIGGFAHTKVFHFAYYSKKQTSKNNNNNNKIYNGNGNRTTIPSQQTVQLIGTQASDSTAVCEGVIRHSPLVMFRD